MQTSNRKLSSIERKKSSRDPGTGNVSWNTGNPIDPYKVPKDAIWKDKISREVELNRSWCRMWGLTVMPKEPHPTNIYNKGGQEVRVVMEVVETPKETKTPKASLNLSITTGKFVTTFVKSSANIGWGVRSPLVDYQRQLMKPGQNSCTKIRFVPEQRGFYRKQNYLRAHGHGTGDGDTPSLTLKNTNTSSKQRFMVNPLLC